MRRNSTEYEQRDSWVGQIFWKTVQLGVVLTSECLCRFQSLRRNSQDCQEQGSPVKQGFIRRLCGSHQTLSECASLGAETLQIVNNWV